jgi:hypothetical protein
VAYSLSLRHLEEMHRQQYRRAKIIGAVTRIVRPMLGYQVLSLRTHPHYWH